MRQPTHRHPVQPRSRVQAGSESVAATLVRADAPNIEMLTDFQSVDAVRELSVRARLLDAGTDVGMPQRDAALVAASDIDNLPGRDGTVSVDPVAPSATISGRGIGDLLAVAAYLCW